MRIFRRRKAAIAVTAVSAALLVSGLGVYAAASNGSQPEATPVERLAAEPTGPGRFARAYGLNPAEATTAFSLRNGETVGVLKSPTAKCLISTGDGRTAGETCDTLAAIDDGQAIAVTDECAVSSKKLMEIIGLVPNDVSSVRLNSSDGTYRSTDVLDGAFKFEGTNPAQGAPYPTGVEWITGSGADAGAAALPVSGDEFCIPTP